MKLQEPFKIVVYGLGKFAEYVAFVINEDTECEVVAYTVEREHLPDGTRTWKGKPVVAFENLTSTFSAEEVRVFIAVGDNQNRARLFRTAKNAGYKFYNYVSSKATVWSDLKIGENVFISEDVGIQPFVSIGDNCILIGPRIGHHCKVGNHCLLSCCYLAGDVTIGDEVFIALNATVKQGIKIANNNVIGMGASIVNDTDVGDIYTSTKNTIKRSINTLELKGRYLS
jgi:sugar O-acyltransferase (sialic acid O-acetyltransferase NeuD family)